MDKQIFTDIFKASEYFDNILNKKCDNIKDYNFNDTDMIVYQERNNIMIVEELWIKVSSNNIDNIIEALNKIQKESNIFIETVDINIADLLDDVDDDEDDGYWD